MLEWLSQNIGTIVACLVLALMIGKFAGRAPEPTNEPLAMNPYGATECASIAELSQALGFAVVELGEYLDTHPGDARAAELFRSYSGLYAQAAAAWEAENGPIVQRSAVGESGYDWLRGPWPWQYAANDGEG